MVNGENEKEAVFFDRKRSKKKFKVTYIQVIVLIFLLIIAVGTALLMLPFATKSGESTSVTGALFTATSATCVTGLVVYDTFTHWTMFGQIVILLMIQIGGLGFMSVATMFSVLLRRKVGLRERELLQEALSTLHVGGIVRLIRFAICGTAVIEGLGAVLLSIRFIPEMGVLKGLWNGVFHSVSAFCNAGFDLMGGSGKFSSLTAYANDVYVNVIIMSLIVIGGIGFLVWEDVCRFGVKFRNYKLHSKIVLITTVVLVLGGAVAFYLLEGNASLAGYGTGEKILSSMFQSITFRTAGFATVDLSKMSPSMVMLSCFFMLIGGSPGSTAGGVKTTTLAVLILGAWSVVRQKKSVHAFNRRLEGDLMKKACAIVVIYMTVAIASVVFLSAYEKTTLDIAMVEVFSAVGTVGLSMGLTPSVGIPSRLLLSGLMFFGRIGGLSMVLALTRQTTKVSVEMPIEKISV